MENPKTHYKKSTITTVIVGLLLLIGATAGSLHAIDNHDSILSAQGAATTTQTSPTTISYTAVAGKTVLAQLQSREKVIVQNSAQYGAYVESVNGIKGGTNNKYWSYYVNGTLADVGAGQYITRSGDKVVWKFQ